MDAESAAVKGVTENGRRDVPEFRAFRLFDIFPNLSLRPWRGFALIEYGVRLDQRAISSGKIGESTEKATGLSPKPCTIRCP